MSNAAPHIDGGRNGKTRIDIWLDDESSFGVVANQDDPAFDALMGQAPQKRHTADQYWKLPMTEPNYRFIAGSIVARYAQEVSISPEAKMLLGAELMRARALDIKARRRAEYVFEETAPTIHDYIFREEMPPKKHQIVAFDACRSQRAFGLFMEMGTGKTKVGIDRACYEMIRKCGNLAKAKTPLPAPEDTSDEAKLDRRDGVYRVLVIAPKSVVRNWNKELIKHATVPYDFIPMLGAAHERIDAILQVLKSQVRLKIVGVNWDALEKYKDILRMCRFHLIIGDESTRIKTPGRKRTKASISIAETAENRMILTGQPITKNVLDLYSQFEFLCPGEAPLGYDNFNAFKNRYTESDPHTGKAIPRNIEELKERVARYAFIVKKKDCLDLPEKTYEREDIEMNPEQAQKYKDMRDMLIAELTSSALGGAKGIVSTRHFIVKILRLAQITSGFLPVKVMRPYEGDPTNYEAIIAHEAAALEDTEIIEFTPNPKLERCIEIIDQTVNMNDDEGQKVLVWCRFKHDIKAIERELATVNIPCVTLYGETKDWEREMAKQQFNENDKIRVFIGQPQSGGIGIDLLGSAKCPTGLEIFYSNDFNLESRSQAEDRAHRIGMHRPVTILDLLCTNTIDEAMLTRLLEKREFSEGFTDAKAMAMAMLAGDGSGS